MSVANRLDEELYALPFDQFSRQFYVSDILNSIRSIRSSESLSILDIGGYKGKTTEFQIQDKVTIADLFDVSEPDYVQVGPDRLPFEDKQFDVTVSFDTFEHVPREARDNFLSEALRVSDTFHVLAAPIDNDNRDVNRSEIIANESYVSMKGEEHRWLKEHIDYLIPTKQEIEKSFDDQGIYYASIATNELATWLQMQQFFFCAELNSECFSQVEKINRYFNQNLKIMEANVDKKNAYRRIYVLTKNKDLFDRFSPIFDEFKKGIYSPENTELQTQHVLELERLIHEGYMLLKPNKES